MIEMIVDNVSVTANILALLFSYVKLYVKEKMELSSKERDHLSKLYLKSFRWFPPLFISK